MRLSFYDSLFFDFLDMKTPNSILFSLVIFFAFTSCTSLATFINGEKRMKIETHQSIVNFANEQNLLIDFEKNLYLKQRKKNEVLANLRTYNNLDKVSFPDVYFFNAEGYFIEDENTVCYNQKIVGEECDYYKDFFNSKELLVSKFKRITDLENEFVNHLGEASFPFDNINQHEYTAIVLWSKYKGKMWANETNFIIHQLKYSSVDIDIYYLNMDLVDF